MIAAVIPLYNHREFIADAVKSVLSQTRRVDRVIVVDDGSTDGSAEVVRQLCDSRVELIQQQNQGAHATINRGVLLADPADYIAILNSDDLFHPSRIERAVSRLETDPRADVVCARFNIIDSEGREQDPGVRARWVDGAWSDEEASLPWWLGVANLAKTTSNLVGRRSYFLSHPFQDYRFVHDYFFVILCALERKLALLPEELLSYRVHSSNTIKSSPPENVTKEVLLMNVNLLRHLAPELALDPAMRRDCALYLRSLMENHSDFRCELFFNLIATLLRDAHPDCITSALASMASFPELNTPSLRSPWERRAEAEYARLQQQLLASRWFALGRAFGFTRDISSMEPSNAQSKLALLRKRLINSTWLKLGRRLGFEQKLG